MAAVCKLEAIYQADRALPSFRIKLPHTAPSYEDVTIGPGAYPTHRHLCAAIETAVENATGYGPTVSGVSGDFYAYVASDGKFGLKSDTMQMVVDFSSAEGNGMDDLRPFMGFTSVTYSAAAVITSDEIPASCFFPSSPPREEEWSLRLDRTANFSDAGRVAAILVGRAGAYRCTLQWTNADHDQWARFARWMYQARKVALWPGYDTAASPWTDNYSLRPYPTSTGHRLLLLDADGQSDLDSPFNAPAVIGHRVQLQGVLYAL